MPNASMSTATCIDPAILDTVLGRLALLFLTGAGDDMTVARNAALHMLIAYRIENEEELSLAAEVISFGCHALQALSQAMEPDLPLNKIIRLRGGAVSLSREAHRNQRKLDQLQRDRRAAAATASPAETTTAQPSATPEAPTIDPAQPAVKPRPYRPKPGRKPTMIVRGTSASPNPPGSGRTNSPPLPPNRTQSLRAQPWRHKQRSPPSRPECQRPDAGALTRPRRFPSTPALSRFGIGEPLAWRHAAASFARNGLTLPPTDIMFRPNQWNYGV